MKKLPNPYILYNLICIRWGEKFPKMLTLLKKLNYYMVWTQKKCPATKNGAYID
jgi:hypothetical protein